MKAITHKFILFCFMAILAFASAAGDKKYPISDIPVTLLINANVVIREYKIDFRINSLKNSVEKYRYVVTILNEQGEDENTMYVFYDRDKKINYFKGNLYDKTGKFVDKLKKSDIEDQSAVSSGSIYEDDRVKYGSLKGAQYPYTVEFEYEVENNNTLFYPWWYPISDKKIALQKASFEIVAPDDYTVRYKTQHVENDVIISSIDGKKHYKWEIKNITPIKTEPYGPKFSDIVPLIYAAPSTFSRSGYTGSMESWQSFGQWINSLNEGRATLPEETKQKIKALTANISSPRGKVKAIYKYLQENTRYVSIQLGIGGYQPFKASFVDEKKYGDCKALTNYTMAMLDVAGINSHYTLVNAGANAANVPRDFPINRFNHVILCVPNNNDTIWLECTSQRSPFGFLGSFTDDRNVLVITDQGGEIVRTPSYSESENLKQTKALVKLDESGNANVELSVTYTGLQFDKQNINIWEDQSVYDQKKWLYKGLDVTGAKINSFSLSTEGDEIPVGTKKIDLTITKYSTVNGKRLFLEPNMFSKVSFYTKKIEKRKSEFFLRDDLVEKDTIIFQIPEGYYVEFKPESKHIKGEYGEYEINVQVENTKLTFTRSFKLKKGRYNPEVYQEFMDFAKKVSKSDNAKVVFVNKT